MNKNNKLFLLFIIHITYGKVHVKKQQNLLKVFKSLNKTTKVIYSLGLLVVLITVIAKQNTKVNNNDSSKKDEIPIIKVEEVIKDNTKNYEPDKIVPTEVKVDINNKSEVINKNTENNKSDTPKKIINTNNNYYSTNNFTNLNKDTKVNNNNSSKKDETPIIKPEIVKDKIAEVVPNIEVKPEPEININLTNLNKYTKVNNNDSDKLDETPIIKPEVVNENTKLKNEYLELLKNFDNKVIKLEDLNLISSLFKKENFKDLCFKENINNMLEENKSLKAINEKLKTNINLIKNQIENIKNKINYYDNEYSNICSNNHICKNIMHSFYRTHNIEKIKSIINDTNLIKFLNNEEGINPLMYVFDTKFIEELKQEIGKNYELLKSFRIDEKRDFDYEYQKNKIQEIFMGSIKIESSENYLKTLKDINLLLEELKNRKSNKAIRPLVIKNNGGGNIIIENNGIKYNTKGNCTIHAFINYIVGILFTIETTFANLEIKKSMEKTIIENLINGVKNMDNNNIWKLDLFIPLNNEGFKQRLFAFSNTPEISKDMFDISIETDAYKILAGGINSNNKVFIDFLIKLYDIFVLFFRGGYSFTKDNKKIEVPSFTNISLFEFKFYAFFLNITPGNIKNNSIEVEKKDYMKNDISTYNIFGNFYSMPEHAENIIYILEEEEYLYKFILYQLNIKRLNIDNESTFIQSTIELKFK